MSPQRRLFALSLSVIALLNLGSPANACGPSFIEPIFVFKDSPDLPFAEYARGNIGILRPSFGRKTLFIAYRYLNGGSFTADEQAALVDALHAKPPEREGAEATKAWIAARNEIGIKEEKLPEIYVERQYSGYDFFPNCTKNSFEVATATLKDRAAKYGPEDRNVRAWLAAQDLVFQNCQSGGAIPDELGPQSPTWLRKDRDYQIGAALLYSLSFDEARARFEKIAADVDSPWQATAEYLVGRTLVRQASLIADEKKRRESYEEAERQLQMIAARHGEFSKASQKLLALIKYRWHPEERVRELAGILGNQSGDDNLKQDLIDYVWLLDKFEDRILKEEEKRKKAANTEKEEESELPSFNKEARERYEAVQRGELIEIGWTPKQTDGKPDYSKYISLYFKPSATRAEVLLAFEGNLGRQLTPDEQKEIDEQYASALKSRQYLVSPNRKYAREGLSQHEGCDYQCGRLSLDLMPDFLRADDLSDWIFTIQTSDPNAYDHALAKWRETKSPAWLTVAIAKGEKASPRVERVMSEAEKIDRNSPAYATAIYNLVRLKIAFGKRAEARTILDQFISSDSEHLPISARNQFLEQKMQLAENVNEFLKFAQRKAVAFYDDGALGTMSELVRIAKGQWDLYKMGSSLVPNQQEESKEEYEQRIDESYRELLPWDDRFAFDEATVDILNWHFPLEELERAARNPTLPDYLRRRLVLAVWTRAVLLRNEVVAWRIAPEVIKVAPEMQPTFVSYLHARTPPEKEHAALFVLLRFPSLSPVVAGGIPGFTTAEDSDYYFETSWWCTPSETEYDIKAERELPKTVSKPLFLTPLELEAARKERATLIAIGDGTSYLGKRVLEWAKNSPNDERIPEALFIAAKANESYKYGCNGWENDKETLEQATALLQKHYPQSPWMAKLTKREDQ